MATTIANGPGFSVDDLEQTMVDWKVATDALFERKPNATMSAAAANNNRGYVASMRNEWESPPHLMPQFDRACLALSAAQLRYLGWLYGDVDEEPSDHQRAAFADVWRQCYMLTSMDLVRCKEFFLRTHWLEVSACADRTNDALTAASGGVGDDDDDAVNEGRDSIDAATATGLFNAHGEAVVKMHVQRIQVIFPLMARALLCYAESQAQAVRTEHAKRQAQHFAYCVERTLCVEYGPIATYACSKYHHAVKALACEWPMLPYDDELQAYVEALLLRAAQLMTISESVAVHDIEFYRMAEPTTGEDECAATSMSSSSSASSLRYVMNDLFVRYLAVTFADMLTDLLLYGQFEVIDLRRYRHGDAEEHDHLDTDKAALHARYHMLQQERRQAHAQEAAERAASGEEAPPPLPYNDHYDNDERFARIADALCVDTSREEAMRAWMRRAQHDPGCNKSRRFIITNTCLWALRPGEMEVFRIDNANRSVAPRDVLRTLRGRTVNDVLTSSHKQLGKLVADEMAAQERQRQQQSRSLVEAKWPGESLLLQLALYEYCSTACYVFANKLEISDYAATSIAEIETRFQELAYSPQPMLVRVFHHFQLVFHGVLYRYDSFVRAFAAWLELMHLVHETHSVRGAPSVQALCQQVCIASAAHQDNRERRHRKAARRRRTQVNDDGEAMAGSPMPVVDADAPSAAAAAAPLPSHLQTLLRFSSVTLNDNDIDMGVGNGQ